MENQTITEEQFLADVMYEIESLRKHATEKEKSKLNFERFDPNSINHCIYGQITGICTSDRAKELIDLGCKRVFSDNWAEKFKDSQKYQEFIPYLNGEYNGQGWYKFGRSLTHITALEGYIYAKDAKIKEIIAYIKGETDKLEL